jgi:hypothetical protein
MDGYRWTRDDVFTNGKNNWRVDAVDGDRAVLRSCATPWATTRWLTFDEWHENGRWTLATKEMR